MPQNVEKTRASSETPASCYALNYTHMSEKSCSTVSHRTAHIVQNKGTPGQGPNQVRDVFFRIA